MKKSIILKARAIIAALKLRHTKPLTVSHSNKKLKPTDTLKFIIWNLPAIVTCPFRTPHCEAKCYAIKAERVYKDCLPSRKTHFMESREADFVDRMVLTILQYALRNKESQIIVRIHESGDFYNQAYTDKWLRIMDICKFMPNVKFICYTKSFPYFDGKKLPKNLAFRASVWDDTPEKDLETIRRNGWAIYTAVDKFQKGDKFTRCRCSDCANCKKCWQKWKDIRCEIH